MSEIAKRVYGSASATEEGVVELATTAETTTGTDATRAVTPDGLQDGYQGSANVTTLGTITSGTWNGTAIEGTAIASTGEVGGTKYLREDGDGTCSWQTVAGGGDVSKVGTPASGEIGVWTGDGTLGEANDISANLHIDCTAEGIQIYEAANDGNPQIRLGATDAEELHIQAVYDGAAQTLDYVLFQTDAASATADKGEFRFNVDGTEIGQINDSGVNVVSGLAYYINDTSVLNATTLGSAVVTSSLTTVGALNSGSITSGFGNIDVGASTIDTTGAVSTGVLTSTSLNLTADSNQIVLDSDAGAGVTTTITDSATAARTLTLPDATDTLVGKATTDTFTNKTFDANGTGNSLSNVETADLASSAKSGLDTTVVTGTAGTAGQVGEWNSDGDLVGVSTYEKIQRYKDFSIPAGAWRPLAGNTATTTSVTYGSHELDVMSFDAAGGDTWYCVLQLPEDYADGTTLKWRVQWDAAATASGTAQFGLSGGAYDDSLALSTALGTARTLTDTLLTVGDLHKSGNDATGVTLAGTPVAGDFIVLAITGDAAGTIAVDTYCLNVQIQYQTGTTTPAVYS